MLQCQEEKYQKADAELNRVYKALMATLDTSQKEQLRTAQRAWIPYRDAHAEFIAGGEAGGSLEPVMRLLALTELTIERTDHLKTVLNSE